MKWVIAGLLVLVLLCCAFTLTNTHRANHSLHCKSRWPSAECKHLPGPRSDPSQWVKP